jgi:ABC-2 type transport system ATP-binding protein
MDVLTVRDLVKRYEGFELRRVSFSVKKGEIMGFIGRNGAGKTTTLRSIINFVHPDAGEVRIFGKSPKRDEREIKRRMAFVSGEANNYMHKSLNAITSATRGFYDDWDDGEYEKLMKLFHLDGRKTPSQLSDGMRVKYALALALSHHAEFFILDEPTSGLDPASREELLDIFLDLARQGATVLFSTHITSDLEKCADRITYIKEGSIIASEALDTFVGGYRRVQLPVLPAERALLDRLIGAKPARQGYSALIRAADAFHFPGTCHDCTLDDIMVHFEKE